MKSNHLPAGTVLMDTNEGWHGRCNRLTGDAAGDITSRFPRPALRDRSQFVQSAVSYPLSCARRRENPPRPRTDHVHRAGSSTEVRRIRDAPAPGDCRDRLMSGLGARSSCAPSSRLVMIHCSRLVPASARSWNSFRTVMPCARAIDTGDKSGSLRCMRTCPRVLGSNTAADRRRPVGRDDRRGPQRVDPGAVRRLAQFRKAADGSRHPTPPRPCP